MNIMDMASTVQNNLAQSLSTSNQELDKINRNRQIINLNGSYMFQDDESMEYLLNQIGLAVQRQGGQ